jgi:hypothetical protein
MINIIFHEPDVSSLSKLGIVENIIAEIENFVDEETASNMIKYFEANEVSWGDVSFYNSSGMGLMDHDPRLADYGLPYDFFKNLRKQLQNSAEDIFKMDLRPNTCHAQKWVPGGFASAHSDNSDQDGVPNAFEINKYVSVLYLNDNYSGGELFFPNHGIQFKPKSLSVILFPGGVENIHGVKEVVSGTRYSMVAFWDFKTAEYSEERKEWWKGEIAKVRETQVKQKKEWEAGKK